MNNRPEIRRVRHETKRRRLTVRRVERLTPKMVRVVLGGDELEGFTSLGFDDHVKLFFPSAPGEEGRVPESPSADHAGAAVEPKPIMRDYTPRRYDADAGELFIDFVIHDAGPATTWAERAAPGQLLDVGGPRGSFIIPTDFDWHLLVGDETALPAIGRRLEELPAGARALVIVEIDQDTERQRLQSSAQLELVWVNRRGAEPGSAERLLEALRNASFPAGQYFAWVAAESRAARAVRRYLVEERGTDKHWIKAAGYWQRGAAATHDRIED